MVSNLWRRGRFIALLGLGAFPLSAQVALYVKSGDTTDFLMVHDVEDGRAVYVRGGKYVSTGESRFVLQKVDEYMPVFIAIRDFHAETGAIQWSTGNQTNFTFTMSGVFESPYHLKHVFAVLELFPESGPPGVVIQQVSDGELLPGKPQSINVTFRAGQKLGDSTYRIHLFSDGREVLTSQLPLEVRERVLDRMVRRRVKNLPDGQPSPFVGPVPEYPKALRKAKTSGSASVRVLIGSNGRVHNPQVVSATDPAFGAAALDVIQQWRFIPKIEFGAPVEATVVMPFNFSPPS